MTRISSPTENTEELPKAIERFLRFNCPNSCDGNGTYTEMDSDGDPEPAQCRWCFEFGMPAREAIEAYKRQAVQAFGEKVLKEAKAIDDASTCMSCTDTDKIISVITSLLKGGAE